MSIELKQIDDIETKQCTENQYDEEDNCQPIENIFDIGNNIVLFDKYVLGIKSQIKFLIFVILCLIFIVVTFCIFILPLFEGLYYYLMLFTIIILYVSIQAFHLMCFITEPGIIPRNCDLYQKKSFEEEDIVFYYRNGETPMEGEVPLFMM